MGCAQSKGQGVSPEPSRAQVDHDDKLDGMLPAGGPPGALAGAPQARGVASELKAPPRPSAAACETPFDPSPEQGGSGQSSACLTLTGSGRSSPQRSRAKDLPPAEPEAASVPPESSVERLAAVRLFCATPPADCCTSVSALLQASLNVPLAFVCLVGESEAHLSQPLQLEQQPGAAWVNLRRGEAPGELAACPQGGVLSVQDMAADARYRELPCVTGPPHLACLAAAPLVASPGEAAAGAVYGSLVVADTKPRTFTAVQLEMLAFSAGSLVRDLEWAAQAARQGQAQRAQQALLRCAQETVEGHAESVLALDASQDGWPVLFCSKAAALAAGPALQQPAGVPFWQVFTVMEENTRLESVGSVWSVDSLASPISAFAPGAGGQSAGQSPAGGAGGASDRLSLAENLRQAMGTPEVAQWLLGPGKPFSMNCRLRSPGQDATLPGSGGSGSLAYQRPLAGWAEEAADTLLPAPRASADARHPQHAAADASPFGRPARMGSLDSALPVMQQGSSLPPKEDAFVASFAPCTPALLRSLGAAAVPDLPDAPAGGSSGNNTSGGSSGGSVPGSLPPCWVVTLRPQPEITTCSLQRAHTACFSGSEEVEAFLRPEAFHDVRLGPLIASGAYGRAYRGLWKGQRVAIKIIPMKSSNDVTPVISGATSADISPVGGTNVYSNASKGSGASNKTPLMEALLSTSLDHPNIVKTLAFGMCQDHDAGQEEVWVLQELCTAGTLARAVEKGAFTDRTTGKPRLRRILLTAIEIASALDFLHSKSLVHADLSGNNVMLNRAGSDERGFVALVGDFGLSRPLDLRSSICTGTYGTPAYMSPEMISEGRLSPEVDIFSAGVLLHEMLSGHRAWQGLSVIQVVNMVAIMKRPLPIPDSWPQPLQELVRSCLSHDPKARPTAKQLRAELTRLLEEEVAGSLVWGSP